MYKKETIEKVVKNLKEKVAYFRAEIENGSDPKKARISDGNRKIGKVLNVSLAPILTCGNCKECKSFCYDIKACFAYPTALNARAYNAALMFTDRNAYFGSIREKLTRRLKNKYFRWHVAGDIVDIGYFAEMVKIAKEFPEFTFWTYTKMYWIVNKYCDLNGRDAIPENLHIMFSKWDGLKMDNPYSFPVFACKLKAGNVDTSEDWFAKVYKCPGNCDLCKEKKLGCIGGMDTYADEH